MPLRSAVVLLTRDLRVHDHPALTAAAATAERVIPLFVLDEGILGSRFAAPNRVGFLLESLADLRERIPLVVRRGDVVEETVRLVAETGAESVHLSADVSAYAQAREERLRDALGVEVVGHPGVTVVPPGEVAPQDRDHYEVFTAYWRAWRRVPAGEPLPAPHLPPPHLPPHDLDPGELPELPAGRSPELVRGGETEGRRRLERWVSDGLAGYKDGLHETSRLSPYLHLGCLSAREVAARCAASGAFVRQLCWRDFYAQLLAARPETAHEDLRPRGDEWVDDAEALAAWKEGRTGFPLVDAGMRQLAREGWMHNRARLVTASFLTKDLGIDWRVGAQHFYDLLLDGDVAQNAGNWQWVAGTGTDSRPNRVFNPTLQAKKLPGAGEYIRRYVEELTAVEDVSEPGLLAPDYPAPILDHAEAVARFRRRRGG